MIEDIIEQIKASELNAKETIQQAKKEHSRIIEKAYEKSEEIAAQSRIEAYEIISNREKKAVKDASREIEKLTAEQKEYLSSIESAAALKKKEAIDLIIKKVFD